MFVKPDDFAKSAVTVGGACLSQSVSEMMFRKGLFEEFYF